MNSLAHRAATRVHGVTSDGLAAAGRLGQVAGKRRLLSFGPARGRGETGRRTGLKIPRPPGHAGSSPAVRTILCTSIALLAAACDPRPDDVPVQVSVIGGPIETEGRRPPSPAARVLAAATAQGLVRFDANGGIEPGLAERWIVIDDGLSIIFRLADAEWPDGSRVTADQVVAALRRATARAARNPLSPYLTAIDEIVAMTPQVIEVRLKRPRPDLLKLFAQPELAIRAPRDDAGSGPFRIVSADRRGVLLRPAPDPGHSPDEEREDPAPEDHVYLRGERAAAAVARFAARGLDLVDGGSIADWPLVAAADIRATDVRIDSPAGLFGFAFVHRDGFLADVRHRAAIAAIIDRVAITQLVRGDWTLVTTVLPEQLDSAAPPAAPDWASTDADARLAIARATVQAYGAPVTLRLALPEASGGNLLWNRVAPMLREAGFVAQRVATDAPADLRLVDQVAAYDSARWYLRTACQPCAEGVAARIVAARDAPDLRDRAQRLAEADAALAADVAFIPVARPFRWSLVARRLRSWAPNARAFHPLNHLRAVPT